MHTEDSGRDGDNTSSGFGYNDPTTGGEAYREGGRRFGQDREEVGPDRKEGRKEEGIINGGVLFRQLSQLPVIITAVAGIFSIGGLYVSFSGMRDDLVKHEAKMELFQEKISSVDFAEMKSVNIRLTRVESSLILIDKQLDRIERNLDNRR